MVAIRIVQQNASDGYGLRRIGGLLLQRHRVFGERNHVVIRGIRQHNDVILDNRLQRFAHFHRVAFDGGGLVALRIDIPDGYVILARRRVGP